MNWETGGEKERKGEEKKEGRGSNCQESAPRASVREKGDINSPVSLGSYLLVSIVQAL